MLFKIGELTSGNKNVAESPLMGTCFGEGRKHVYTLETPKREPSPEQQSFMEVGITESNVEKWFVMAAVYYGSSSYHQQ